MSDIAELHWTCDAVPLQAEGRTADGFCFYFRARHQHWGMMVWYGYVPPEDDQWQHPLWETRQPYENAGYMPKDVGQQLIIQSLGEFRASWPNPLDERVKELEATLAERDAALAAVTAERDAALRAGEELADLLAADGWTESTSDTVAAWRALTRGEGNDGA